MTNKNNNAELFKNRDDYQYGFHDENTALFSTGKGLTEKVVRQISAAKGEPDWVLDYRLKAFAAFEKMPMPKWGPDLSNLDFSKDRKSVV